MSSFLAKRILLIASYFSSSSPLHYHHRHQLALLTPLSLLRRSLSSESQQQPKEKVAQYLISSFGFSPHRALKYSAQSNLPAIKSSAQSNLPAIKSSDRPESVVRFLKDTGLSDDQIKSAVSFHPRLLAADVEKTLKPKVRELMDGGFSGELLVHLIRCSPHALCLKGTLSRLLFWRDFAGNEDEVLLKIIKRNTLIITCDIDKHVVPRINLFKEFGLSNRDIVSLMTIKTHCLSQNLYSLREALELIEEMGISRGSRMFVCCVKMIGGFSKDKIKRNAEFFKVTYGWSQEEVYTAFRKFPSVLAFSEDKVKSNMDFLIRKAGFESRNIALRPQLLGYSVERVLIPRYTVLRALEAKGLKKKCSLSTPFGMSRSKFLERYVVPYEKDVPGLGKAYAAGGGGEVLV